MIGHAVCPLDCDFKKQS